MDKLQQVMKYFATAHTSEGFVNYLTTNLYDIDEIIVLQHPSNIVKTKIFEELIRHYQSSHHIEVICSPHNKHYIDGMIIRDLSLAVLVDHITENIEIKAKTLNLKEYITNVNGTQNFYYLQSEKKRLQEKAYAHFKAALMIHDQLEEVYINEMDFKKADKIADHFISGLFNDLNISKNNGKSIVYERLFGTNTPDGFLNYLVPLIEPIGKRIYIKGRAGTGKSFFMKKVLKACKDHGFQIELYRCSFDPNSIDMLIIRDLDICLFDSTPPHELFPARDSDEIIDFYEKTVTPGTDEKYASLIQQLTKNYKLEMKIGREKLHAIKLLEANKEACWENVSLDEIQKVVKELIKKK